MKKIGIPKGIKGAKSRLPSVLKFCYPNYRELQKGTSMKKMREQAEKKKNPQKRDPRFITPYTPDEGRF